MRKNAFDEQVVLSKIKKYLPHQAPLKDFVHHNTLHAFQDLEFDEALTKAKHIFGYKTYLSLSEYRNLYEEGKIKEHILATILEKYLQKGTSITQESLLKSAVNECEAPRIGKLKAHWKSVFKIDLDTLVHPMLFRIVGSYLDQGVSLWAFPTSKDGFLASIIELEAKSKVSFFKTERVRNLLLENKCSLNQLLHVMVGLPDLYEQYLFDQQFAHPGWSGMVAYLDTHPEGLVDARKISLEEFIVFELLLEIDALDSHFGEIWSPLGLKITGVETAIFEEVPVTQLASMYAIWQQAYEWSYYNQILGGIQDFAKKHLHHEVKQEYQALFCIDDRECSIRRYVEQVLPSCGTYGTAGFFNLEFYFKPADSKFMTKVCPAPIHPKFVIKEHYQAAKKKQDFHMDKHAHGLLGGWILTHTLGFWSAIRLLLTVFKPSDAVTSIRSSMHMHPDSHLTIEHAGEFENELQVGFTIDQMTDRLEGLLRSIGLTEHFAPLIYVIGHGSSSANNTHYAGYDCGACSGRPGSVNARVLAFIGNHAGVRKNLAKRGIVIPENTHFVGALHDTSRDEIVYYDENEVRDFHVPAHKTFTEVMENALDLTAKERSRRFMSIQTAKSPKKVHEQVKLRTVSLFEPRPELNHATNTLAIVSRRALTKDLFLDRRAFLNSYDYEKDPEGKILASILGAITPVCGGINLEYYFSRTDNETLGAGSKLPHNVVGLFGVANGTDGDLRTGLPSQMIEVHEPLRLLMLVEHHPEIVLKAIQQNPATYNWYAKNWVHLAAIDPVSKAIFFFNNGVFELYQPTHGLEELTQTTQELIEREHDSLPIHHIKTA
jgi:uncharacterized protein YbcC (UPF0753/DUF2309 family)